jgi:hypothetical protein
MSSTHKIQLFAIKDGTSATNPRITGNGFDGLQIGASQEEAEAFLSWVNTQLQMQSINPLTDDKLDQLWDDAAGYFALYQEARDFARALLNRSGVAYQLSLVRRLADALRLLELATSGGPLGLVPAPSPVLKEALDYLANQELEIADLSHLSGEQFNALCPQGFHGVGDD